MSWRDNSHQIWEREQQRQWRSGKEQSWPPSTRMNWDQRKWVYRETRWNIKIKQSKRPKHYGSNENYDWRPRSISSKSSLFMKEIIDYILKRSSWVEIWKLFSLKRFFLKGRVAELEENLQLMFEAWDNLSKLKIRKFRSRVTNLSYMSINRGKGFRRKWRGRCCRSPTSCRWILRKIERKTWLGLRIQWVSIRIRRKD